MKRDMDLVRKLLLAIEEKDERFTSESLEVFDYSSDEIDYHCAMLLEAGIIRGKPIGTMGSPDTCLISGISFEGHEYLDSIRDNKVWSRVKDKSKKAGVTLTFDIVRDVAKTIAKELIT